MKGEELGKGIVVTCRERDGREGMVGKEMGEGMVGGKEKGGRGWREGRR